MPAQNAAPAIRRGVLALPLAGPLLLAAALVLGRTPYLAADTDPRGTALSLVSTGYAVGMALDIAGVTFALFGVIALVAQLSTGRSGRWALAALVPSVVGLALILSFLGATSYAFPAVGRAYLGGQPGALGILGDFFTGAGITVALLADPLVWLGFLLFGVAIWRAGALPRAAAILLAAHAPLVHGPLALVSVGGVPVFALLGAALLTLGGAWIARSHPRPPAAGQPVPALRPRAGQAPAR